jgi:acetyltransferase-like isoleucine patch superfamily enzyme
MPRLLSCCFGHPMFSGGFRLRTRSVVLALALLSLPYCTCTLTSGQSNPKGKPASPSSGHGKIAHTPVKLTASDGKKVDEFGYSVAISGKTIIVGAPYATVGSTYAQGAAYVFEKSTGNSVIYKAKLTASDGEGNAFFGSSVSISGDTVIIGADGANVASRMHQGAAYVFIKPEKGWRNVTETAKLIATDGAALSYFGSSVSINDDTVLIGSDGATVGANKFQGAVYVFVKPVKGWTGAPAPQAKLTAGDGMKEDQLGYAVEVSGDTVVAGARSATVNGHPRQGATYVFVKPATGWKDMIQTAKLSDREGTGDDRFGSAVSIDGENIAVGSPGSHSRGSVHVFVKPVNGWVSTQVSAKLVASDGAPGDQLGIAVSIKGNTLWASAPSATVGSNTGEGALYMFAKSSGGWMDSAQTSKVSVPNGEAKDAFGSSVSTTNDTLVSGAPKAKIGSHQYQGAAFLFQQPASR